MPPYIYELVLNQDTDSFKKGSKYIGQHNGRSSRYWAGGVIPNSIAKKYGKGVFDRRIVVSGDFNSTLLNALEKHYIRLYNSDMVGLNLTAGGDSGSSVTRDIIPVYLYTIDGKYLRSFESRAKLGGFLNTDDGNISKGLSSPNNNKTVAGYRISFDKWDSLPKSLLRDYIELHQYSLDGSYLQPFECIQEAIKVCNPQPRKIRVREAIDNETRQTSGYQWRSQRVENCGEYIPVEVRSEREVVGYNKSNEEVFRFESAAKAAEVMEVDSSNITRACHGDIKTCKGLQWRFSDTFLPLDNIPQKPEKVTLACVFCGQEYKRAQRDVERSKFCSKICKDSERRGRPMQWAVGFVKGDPRLPGNKFAKGNIGWSKRKTNGGGRKKKVVIDPKTTN